MAQPSSSSPGMGDDSASQGADPSQGQPAPQGGQDQQGGGAITQLLSNVGGALQHLEQVFHASKDVDPQDQQLISQIVQMYGQLMNSISGESKEQEAPASAGQAQGQTSPMEAGGNKNAQPVM